MATRRRFDLRGWWPRAGLPAPAAVPRDGEDDRRDRQQRLQLLYEHCQNLLLHESRFVIERSTSFLSANALLFAGFVVISTQTGAHPSGWVQALRAAICVLGLSFSAAHPLIIAQTLDALDFWRNTLGLIEQDPDYWYPTDPERDQDLDLFSARARHWQGMDTRQHAARVRPPTLPAWIHANAKKLPPNRFYAGYLSGAFAVMWIVGLCWTISDIVT